MVAVSNAPERGTERNEPGKSAAEAAPSPRRRAGFAAQAARRAAHLPAFQPARTGGRSGPTDIVCAVLTYVQGIGVKELAATADKVVLFHPSPWLGISFIALILFVAVFTNVRARGVYSFMLILIAGGLFWLALKIPGVDTAFGWLSLLRVHLNLAFYLTFSAPFDVHLAVRHRFRRSLHLVAVLARPGHRGAPDRSGHRPCLQHGGHGGAEAAGRSLPAPPARPRTSQVGGRETSSSNRPTRTPSRSTMSSKPAVSSAISSS